MHLKITNLNKSYKNNNILNNISLDINNVSSIGIIGESGCGKSTLLRQLAGIENPDSGDIIINNISPIGDKLDFQKKIGYVFQKHNLFPHLTIEKNILLILEKIKKIPKQQSEKITKEVLEKLHMLEQANKLPDQVSGGQAQRASIARALSLKPDILFLDEPTASLDPLLTNEVLTSIKELKNTGVEFIFITHEMQFLKEFCDYFIFLKKGQIQEVGSVLELEKPKTKELKNFLEF